MCNFTGFGVDFQNSVVTSLRSMLCFVCLQQALENSGLSAIPVQSDTQNSAGSRPEPETATPATEGADTPSQKSAVPQKLVKKEKRSIFKKPVQMQIGRAAGRERGVRLG